MRVPNSGEGKFGGYAYVLLRDANEPERNRLACARFIGTFPAFRPQADLQPQDVVSVAWPVNVSPAVPGLARDCSWLLQNYDFSFSTTLLKTIKCETGTSYVRGPVLVASESPATADDNVWNTKEALVVDLSTIEPAEWVSQFRAFYDQIELGPREHWGASWFERTLEALKSVNIKASRFLNGHCL